MARAVTVIASIVNLFIIYCPNRRLRDIGVYAMCDHVQAAGSTGGAGGSAGGAGSAAGGSGTGSGTTLTTAGASTAGGGGTALSSTTTGTSTCRTGTTYGATTAGSASPAPSAGDGWFSCSDTAGTLSGVGRFKVCLADSV